MTGKQRVTAMIGGQQCDCLPLMPITMQFAADRIGRNYRDYAADHRLLTEAQMRVADEFSFDYVSAISDPAREAADCGATVFYPPDAPPAIDESNALLSDKTKLATLRRPDPLGGGRMTDRVLAVEQLSMRTGRDRIVEGWIEGPCAQAADLRGINALMLDFIDDEKFVRDVMAFVIEMEVAFARVQVEAGATLIGIGDAAASLVGPEIYDDFVLSNERLLIDHVHNLGVPVRLHICGNASPLLEDLGQLRADIIDLDYPVSVASARRMMPAHQVLLGNIDPVRTLRDGTAESVYTAIGKCHLEAGPHYIVGAGCEVPRDTKPELVHAMRRYAKEHRP